MAPTAVYMLGDEALSASQAGALSWLNDGFEARARIVEMQWRAHGLGIEGTAKSTRELFRPAARTWTSRARRATGLADVVVTHLPRIVHAGCGRPDEPAVERAQEVASACEQNLADLNAAIRNGLASNDYAVNASWNVARMCQIMRERLQSASGNGLSCGNLRDLMRQFSNQQAPVVERSAFMALYPTHIRLADVETSLRAHVRASRRSPWARGLVGSIRLHQTMACVTNYAMSYARTGSPWGCIELVDSIRAADLTIRSEELKDRILDEQAHLDGLSRLLSALEAEPATSGGARDAHRVTHADVGRDTR